jgi:hydroxymethylpyrimidine/phosphomethylpyrimidine kinase
MCIKKEKIEKNSLNIKVFTTNGINSNYLTYYLLLKIQYLIFFNKIWNIKLLCLYFTKKKEKSKMNKRYNAVLTIAGSDSGGGAGIQADIKSISANGAYASTVITASTAQNTQGITDIHPIPIAHVQAQLDTVLSDIQFGAVKIGMLHSSEVITIVKDTLKKYGIDKIILDPVMIASSGNKLLNDEAFNALKAFLPHVYLVTPNIPEAELLIGHTIGLENIKTSTKEIGEKFSVSVLLKGGHLEAQALMTDTLYIYESKKIITIQNPAVKTKHTHGTGCSLSSTIATYISLGYELEKAVIKSCQYVNEAIDAGKEKLLGKGNSPINHFKIR